MMENYTLPLVHIAYHAGGECQVKGKELKERVYTE
jgi:hypothetical protein